MDIYMFNIIILAKAIYYFQTLQIRIATKFKYNKTTNVWYADKDTIFQIKMNV